MEDNINVLREDGLQISDCIHLAEDRLHWLFT